MRRARLGEAACPHPRPGARFPSRSIGPPPGLCCRTGSPCPRAPSNTAERARSSWACWTSPASRCAGAAVALGASASGHRVAAPHRAAGLASCPSTPRSTAWHIKLHSCFRIARPLAVIMASPPCCLRAGGQIGGTAPPPQVMRWNFEATKAAQNEAAEARQNSVPTGRRHDAFYAYLAAVREGERANGHAAAWVRARTGRVRWHRRL